MNLIHGGYHCAQGENVKERTDGKFNSRKTTEGASMDPASRRHREAV